MTERLVAIKDSTINAFNAWLRDRGEGALNTTVGAFLWGAAAHAAYCVAVPAPLRPVVEARNARRARAAALAALAVVCAYDAAQGRRLDSERAALTAAHRRMLPAAAGEEDVAVGAGGAAE